MREEFYFDQQQKLENQNPLSILYLNDDSTNSYLKNQMVTQLI